MRQLTRRSLAAFALLLTAAPLHAQRYSDDDDNARWLDQCRNNWNSDRDRGRAPRGARLNLRVSPGFAYLGGQKPCRTIRAGIS